MAGDWIKVEIATSRKTEVLRIAEMLGIDRRACMGLLIDYWGWLDANARTEFVPNLSRKSLDDVLNCAGLASCLEAVGWAKWSDDGWTMQVVNYEHHNGTSAKTRAYEQRKKKIQRDKTGDKTGTREEKRRVNTERESIDAPTDEHRQIANQLAIDCDVEWLKYRDQQANAPRKHSDLQAGFRNWLRRAKEFKPQPRAGPATTAADRRSDVADQMYRRGKYAVANDTERDITGSAERVG